MEKWCLFYIVLPRSKARGATEEGNEERENDQTTEQKEKRVANIKLKPGIKYLPTKIIHLADDWFLGACQWLAGWRTGSMTEWQRRASRGEETPRWQRTVRDKAFEGIDLRCIILESSKDVLQTGIVRVESMFSRRNDLHVRDAVWLRSRNPEAETMLERFDTSVIALCYESSTSKTHFTSDDRVLPSPLHTSTHPCYMMRVTMASTPTVTVRWLAACVDGRVMCDRDM